MAQATFLTQGQASQALQMASQANDQTRLPAHSVAHFHRGGCN